MKRILCLTAVLVAVMSFRQPAENTIGIYPGNPEENFAPTLVPGGETYRNLALERAALQSSAIDVNQAAQLVTDGLLADEADFRSAWKSASGKDEWIAVDLGGPARIERLVFHWINGPTSGKLLLSQDGKKWKDAGPLAAEISLKKLKCRYVKAVLDASADGESFELEEWEIWGRGGVVPQAKPAPVREGMEQALSGGNWKLVRASALPDTVFLGEKLSSPDFDDSTWMVATVPGTVLGSYVAAGAVLHPNYQDWQLFISDSYFHSDFWYRDVFEAHPDSPRQFLCFDGINYKAHIFLNGKCVGRIESAFDAARFDVTGMLNDGTNYLAVRIVCNPHYGEARVQNAFWPNLNGGILGADNPTMHATIGWDWIPSVRGRNIGIYDKVYVRYTGEVTVEDPFVRTQLPLPDTTHATILASTVLKNHSDKPADGVVRMRFGDLTIECPAHLEPGESRKMVFEPTTLENPRLWWPNGYGRQELYPVTIGFEASDSVSFLAGVRQLDYDLAPYEPVGKLYFKSRNEKQRLSVYVNGRRVVGFGGNWGYPEHLLSYGPREYDIAVGYHAAQNFTLIRNWVGMTDNKAFYDACDRHGILIWQDFWLANPYDGPNPYDVDKFNAVARRYVRRIRNHPSIALYVGRNEGYPPQEIEDYLASMVPEEHPGSYFIPHSGADGVSGGGPYRALTNKEFFSLHSQDKITSERGMPTMMNYENLVRTLGEENVNPVNTLEHPNRMYGMHDYTLGEDGKWSAQRCTTFNSILENGFGKPADAREFSQLAQWVNYDGYRAIFEGRSMYRRGALLWMSHPAWPSLVWQTYDYFFEPTAAFFAAKKACEPVHILYNPVKDSVAVVNYHARDLFGLKATARVLDMYGREVWSRSMALETLAEDSTVYCFPPEVPEDITDVYFVKLALSKGDTILSENFYWQGKTDGDYKALRCLGKARVSLKQKSIGKNLYCVKLDNKSDVPALMIRLKAIDRDTDDLALPVWYSDNYFFLMPGESKEVTVAVEKGRITVQAEGFNL
ncbi:MAG: discoidin domain-containing protein [Bacteroidales bacterium]|nr:discoidin domain-containing protein [Bacteroidales bacterium]